MEYQKLLQKLAKLETMNDQLAAELDYLEKLTRALGFAEGLKTLKSAAIEMIEADRKRSQQRDK